MKSKDISNSAISMHLSSKQDVGFFGCLATKFYKRFKIYTLFKETLSFQNECMVYTEDKTH